MGTPMTFADTRLAKLDGFRVEIDPERERADVILDRPPFNIIEMRATRPVAARVRGARRRPAGTRDRAARRRRAFFQWRQHQGLSGSLARARVQACLEHRGAGTLRQAGNRRQPRLLLRRRLRNFARLRFPACVGDLLLCACRNSGSGRSLAPAARRACKRSSASPAPRTS